MIGRSGLEFIGVCCIFWRDLRLIVGHNFEAARFFDRDSIETWRYLSVISGHNFETNHYFDRDSIHASRDMSVEMPPGYEVIHGNDLDTALDSRVAGSERHIRPRFRNEFLF